MSASTQQPVKQKASAKDRPMLLIVPPFQGIRCPALSVSQLKGNLQKAGFKTQVLYLNLRFAERITPKVLEWLSGTGPYLLGEYIFSHAVHDFTDKDTQRYIDDVLKGTDLEPELEARFPGKTPFEALNYLINEAREFIANEAIEEVLSYNPWMVGLSSTFQSNCCSLAVIHELKKQRPDIFTVMGGANCEAEMGEELLSRYDAIDFIGRGECDQTFVELVKALQAGETGAGIKGFLSRQNGSMMPPSRPLNGEELDENAYPDFSDFFEQLSNCSYNDHVVPGLAMETSRGCWWGMKQHCTFCAFNRLGMVFRSKSAPRALEEMTAHVQEHGISRMELTDNILELDYFKSLLPMMSEESDIEIFCEIKSNLTREQIALLRQANFRWLQPGLESLSDRSLKLMKKGTSQLQNVQTLKWSAEYGIRITWNWLFGFPGEDEDEVNTLAESVKAIHHLEPPGCATVLYVERFAPYQTTPEQWDITDIRPARAYGHVYPFPDESLERLAFFFDCNYFEKKEESEAFKKLQRIVNRWLEVSDESHFIAVPYGNSLMLFDTRPVAKRFVRRLTGLKKRIYEYCGQNRSQQGVLRAFDGEASPEKLKKILASFVRDGLMLESDNRYLSLAADPSVGYKKYPDSFPGGAIVIPGEKEANKSNQNAIGQKVLNLITFKTSPIAVMKGVSKKFKLAIIRRIVAAVSNPQAQNGRIDRVEPADQDNQQTRQDAKEPVSETVGS